MTVTIGKSPHSVHSVVSDDRDIVVSPRYHVRVRSRPLRPISIELLFFTAISVWSGYSFWICSTRSDG